MGFSLEFKLPISLISVVAVTVIIQKYIEDIRKQEILKRFAQEGLNPLALVPLVFEVLMVAIQFLIEFPKRLTYLLDSLMLVGTGIANEITAIAKSVPVIVSDTIQIVSCGIKHAGNFNTCAKYYGLSLILTTLYTLLVTIPVSIFKAILGIDLQPTVDSIWWIINCIDEMMFEMVGFHISRYPDPVIERCYNCELPSSSDVATIISALGKPVTDIINGAITFVSVFTGKKPQFN